MIDFKDVKICTFRHLKSAGYESGGEEEEQQEGDRGQEGRANYVKISRPTFVSLLKEMPVIYQNKPQTCTSDAYTVYIIVQYIL